MKVAFVWPNYDKTYEERKLSGNSITDVFFVGLTKEEVDRIYPDVEYKDSDFSPKEFLGKSLGEIGERLWFMIPRDLAFKSLCHWFYPRCNMWNGDSPFLAIKMLDIKEIEELRDLF